MNYKKVYGLSSTVFIVDSEQVFTAGEPRFKQNDGQWITLGEKSCLLVSSPKLALGQPDNR